MWQDNEVAKWSYVAVIALPITSKYIRSGGLESKKARVDPEIPMVAGDYDIPLHPHFLYTMLYAGAVLKH